MIKIYTYFILLLAIISCSNFDEQEFTVLIPNAGEDQIVFTEDTGTTIQLNGNESSDVNNTGFDYSWEITASPEGFPASLSSTSVASPTLEVPFDAAGRYQLQLSIFIEDQVAFDFVNIDINPANAQILFVNAIDSGLAATLTIPAIDLIGTPVVSKTSESTYHNVDTNIATQDDGTTLIEIAYNGTTISTNETLEALKVYTLYLVGTEDSPEIILVEKTRNQNNIGIGLVALDAVNLVQDLDNVVLFIDASAFGFGTLPLDTLFNALGVPEQFGFLNFLDNTELFFPSANVNPLPIWATVNGIRISNNTTIGIPGVDGNFGTFILFPDASSADGNTLIFLNNSELLPL